MFHETETAEKYKLYNYQKQILTYSAILDMHGKFNAHLDNTSFAKLER